MYFNVTIIQDNNFIKKHNNNNQYKYIFYKFSYDKINRLLALYEKFILLIVSYKYLNNNDYYFELSLLINLIKLNNCFFYFQ